MRIEDLRNHKKTCEHGFFVEHDSLATGFCHGGAVVTRAEVIEALGYGAAAGRCPENYWEPGLGPCICEGSKHGIEEGGRR